MNALDKNRSRPLHAALDKGYIDVTLLVLEHGIDVNVVDRAGQTPLHKAPGRRHINFAQLLLEHSVDVNAKDNNGSTALHLALEESRPRVRKPVT